MRNMFICFLIVCTTIGCATPELMESTGFRSPNYAHASESDPLPGWVLSELKKYPLETFLFEVGKRPGTDKEAFEMPWRMRGKESLQELSGRYSILFA